MKSCSMEYLRKNPTPMTRIKTPKRSSQVLATANSIETPTGRCSSPTAIQCQIFSRISPAAVSNRLGWRGAVSATNGGSDGCPLSHKNSGGPVVWGADGSETGIACASTGNSMAPINGAASTGGETTAASRTGSSTDCETGALVGGASAFAAVFR